MSPDYIWFEKYTYKTIKWKKINIHKMETDPSCGKHWSKIFKFRVKFITAHKTQFHLISGINFSDTNALIFMIQRVNKMPPETLSFHR